MTLPYTAEHCKLFLFVKCIIHTLWFLPKYIILCFFIQKRHFCYSAWHYVCNLYVYTCAWSITYVMTCMKIYVDLCVCVCIPQHSLSCWQRVALSVWQAVLNCSGYCWLPAWHPFVLYHLPLSRTPHWFCRSVLLSVYESWWWLNPGLKERT